MSRVSCSYEFFVKCLISKKKKKKKKKRKKKERKKERTEEKNREVPNSHY